MRHLVTLIIGTRPEAIKMAPVIWELERNGGRIRTRTVVTGQHDHLLKQALEEMHLVPDVNLSLMQHGETLPRMLSRAVDAVGQELMRHRPDIVLVQGDTMSACAGALAAFMLRVPVGHVEAGLRTYHLNDPFPEEGNRQIITRLATVHFAPTKQAVSALLRERVPRSSIHLTGNTVVDALLEIARNQRHAPRAVVNGRTILLTAHRRENFGRRMENIFEAVRDLTREFADLHVIYPVHPNPNVSGPALNFFRHERRVHLVDPLPYVRMIGVLREVDLVMTDSGGLQEEAPVFGKPVLVLRKWTERPEAILAGTARLVGTERNSIVTAARELLEHRSTYRRMAAPASPFGDGKASARIVKVLRRMLSKAPGRSAVARRSKVVRLLN